ncbi:MAG: hypothetical protein ABJH68_18520 [Ilumatobacter sp.]|uniref:hypothetical protein n=1 Tax=Ilumatobacter sp. TaxID=1967498 RepID=UPI00329A1B63
MRPGPDAEPRATSSVNFAPGAAVANSVITPVLDGEVCAYNSAKVEIIADVAGWIAPANLLPTEGGASRAFDSRCVATSAQAGESVVLNANGFLNVFPSSATADPTLNSTVNFRAGANVANGTIVPAGADGRICVYSSGATQVLLDVAGYMKAGVFVPLNADGSATRVLNTRGF